MPTAIINQSFSTHSRRPALKISERYPIGVSAIGASRKHFAGLASDLAQQHISRVNADGGTVENSDWVETVILATLNGGWFYRIWCFYDVEMGYKKVTEGSIEYVTKLYSIHGTNNDATASGTNRPILTSSGGRTVMEFNPAQSNQMITDIDDDKSFGGNKSYISGLFIESDIEQGLMGYHGGNTRAFNHDGINNLLRFKAGNNTLGDDATSHGYDPESEQSIQFDETKLAAMLWDYNHVRRGYIDKIFLDSKSGDGEAWMNRVGYNGAVPGDGFYFMFCRVMRDMGVSVYEDLVDTYLNKGSAPDPEPTPGEDEGVITQAANTQDVGDFKDHGIGISLPFRRGLVSSQNSTSDDVLLMLFGGDSVMEINIDTEAFEEHFYSATGVPHTSLLASDWVYYTAHGGVLVIFDPSTSTLTEKSVPNMDRVYGMYEDHNGRVWGIGRADDYLVSIFSYDPSTDTATDYGVLLDMEGSFRPKVRNFAGDDQAWIYFAIGGDTDRVYGFKDGDTALTDLGAAGSDANAFERGQDGKCYHNRGDAWIELYAGVYTVLGSAPDTSFLPEAGFGNATGSQSLYDNHLRNSNRRVIADLDYKEVDVIDKSTGDVIKRVSFTTPIGAGEPSLMVATDNSTLIGATIYPWRWWRFYPAADEWTLGTHDTWQWNAITKLDNGLVYVGGYPGRGFIVYDPANPYNGPGVDAADNPQRLNDGSSGRPDIWRNTDIAASLPDNRYVVTCGYSEPLEPAGGLMVWDRNTGILKKIAGSNLFSGHNIHSLVPLSNSRFLLGTTVYQWAGAESEVVAKLAIIDIETEVIEWQGTPVADARTYFDMHRSAANDFVYICVTSTRQNDPRLFKFDVDTKAVAEITVPASLQDDVVRDNGGPSVFMETTGNRLFMLFYQGIAEIDLPNDALHKWADNPTGLGRINKGGNVLDGRIYFSDDQNHLWSWAVPAGGIP